MNNLKRDIFCIKYILFLRKGVIFVKKDALLKKSGPQGPLVPKAWRHHWRGIVKNHWFSFNFQKLAFLLFEFSMHPCEKFIYDNHLENEKYYT